MAQVGADGGLAAAGPGPRAFACWCFLLGWTSLRPLLALLLRVPALGVDVEPPPRSSPAAGTGAGCRAAAVALGLALVLVWFPQWGPHQGAAAKPLAFPMLRLLSAGGCPLLLLLVALVPDRPLVLGALLLLRPGCRLRVAEICWRWLPGLGRLLPGLVLGLTPRCSCWSALLLGPLRHEVCWWGLGVRRLARLGVS